MRTLRVSLVVFVAALLAIPVVAFAADVEMTFYGDQHFKFVTPGGKIILVNPWVSSPDCWWATGPVWAPVELASPALWMGLWMTAEPCPRSLERPGTRALCQLRSGPTEARTMKTVERKWALLLGQYRDYVRVG